MCAVLVDFWEEEDDEEEEEDDTGGGGSISFLEDSEEGLGVLGSKGSQSRIHITFCPLIALRKGQV